MSQSAQSQVGPQAVSSGPTRDDRKRILVVDDDHVILCLLTRAITLAGYHVDTAPDGNVGWRTLEQNSYDLLVTDYNMPGMTGLDLIRKVRASTRVLPCVLFSSLLPGSDEDIMKIVQHGSVLEKESTFSRLLTEIVRLLHEPGGESPPDRFRDRNFIIPLSPPPSSSAA